jgi:hypothetical protein
VRTSRLLKVVRRLPAALSDRGFRVAVLNELAARDVGRRGSGAAGGLLPTSRLFAGLVTEARPRAVNLVIGGVGEGALFAGADTALVTATRMAVALGAPCRIVTTDARPSPATVSALSARYGTELTVVAARDVPRTAFSTTDVWVATHFLTAHALQEAADRGLLDRERVVYLVQDYEPGFVPWSTDSVLAQATYHAGFHLLVNSEPVAAHIRTVEGLEIPDDRVFAPVLPLERLATIAARRSARIPRRLAFYGRPTRARNLYGLGLAALRSAVELLGPRSRDIEFVSMGAPTQAIPLGGGVTLRPGEKLGWDAYYDFLGDTDVVLSLQQSPHPSHPPLEAALAGAASITNEFGGTRVALHPGLRAVAPTVEALAGALVDSLGNRPRTPVVAGLTTSLGGRMEDAVDAVLAHVTASGSAQVADGR